MDAGNLEIQEVPEVQGLSERGRITSKESFLYRRLQGIGKFEGPPDLASPCKGTLSNCQQSNANGDGHQAGVALGREAVGRVGEAEQLRLEYEKRFQQRF